MGCSKKNIYEFKIYTGNQQMVDRDLPILQEQGWEVAGALSIDISKDGYNHRLVIPLKRKICLNKK